MLQLPILNKHRNILNRKPEYINFDANFYSTSRFNGNYIEHKHIGGLLAPILLRGYDWQQISIVAGDKNPDIPEQNETMNSVINFDTLDSKSVVFIKVYTKEPEAWANTLSTDIYKDIPNTVKELYTKAYTQVHDRAVDRGDNYAIYTYKFEARVSKSKHIIFLFTNVLDQTQATDSFLTVGLIPILFPDLREVFSDEREQNYFKAIVKRSQLKRVSNVEVTEAYTELMGTDIYDELVDKLMWEATLKTIVDNKISSAKMLVMRTQNKAEDLLQDYGRLKEQYFNAQKVLTNLEANKQETIENIKDSLNIDGIAKVDVDGTTIKETVVVPLVYYDSDAAELALTRSQYEGSPAVKLLKEIFLEQKYKMYVAVRYTFSFEDGTHFSPTSNVPTDIMSEYKALFNPHIKFYSCFGDYRPQLESAFAKKDLLLFNNLAVASAKSINFTDGVVTNRFIQELNESMLDKNYYTQIECLEDSDGNRLSLSDWLEKGEDDL